ncbi:MAG: iron chelate uptake ABC transporter family permease subunit [Candidatus Babeliales bacterium]
MTLLHDPTFILVLTGVSIFGFVCAVLGTFAMLNKQSLLADTMSHAALPGVALAFLYTQSNSPLALLVGGAISGIFGALLVLMICHVTPLKKDAALGFVLSAFFGLGLVLLTVIQKQAISNQAILNKLLFGCAATLLPQEVHLMTIAACIILLTILLFWKQLVLVSFDQVYAVTVGVSVLRWQALLMCLLAVVIVLGLPTVGVVLMSTLCIAPAAAMRQWTSRINRLTIAAGLCGATCAAIGVLLSSIFAVPTGPAIVVVATSVMLLSLWCAPRWRL